MNIGKRMMRGKWNWERREKGEPDLRKKGKGRSGIGKDG